MGNRDYMKAFGEWLCSIAPNSLAKSLTHDSMRAMYEKVDFEQGFYLTNLHEQAKAWAETIAERKSIRR